MMKKNKISRTERKIELAIKLVQDEIDLHEKNKGTVSNIPQLKKIAESLHGMKVSLGIESPDWIYVGFGRAIVDSWPMQSSLGIKLLEVEQEYKSFLR